MLNLQNLYEVTPVDTRRRFNVYKSLYDVADVLQTSYRRWNDVVCLLGLLVCTCLAFSYRNSCLGIFRATATCEYWQNYQENIYDETWLLYNGKFLSYNWQAIIQNRYINLL